MNSIHIDFNCLFSVCNDPLYVNRFINDSLTFLIYFLTDKDDKIDNTHGFGGFKCLFRLLKHKV